MVIYPAVEELDEFDTRKQSYKKMPLRGNVSLGPCAQRHVYIPYESVGALQRKQGFTINGLGLSGHLVGIFMCSLMNRIY